MWLGPIDCIFHWSRYDPQRIAVRIDGIDFTYADLVGRAIVFKHEIVKKGVAQGRVAIFSNDKLTFLVSLLAAQHAGLATIILNPLLDHDALIQTVKDSQPTFALTDDTGKARLVSCGAFNPDCIASPLLGQSIPASLLRERPEAVRERDGEWGVLFSSGSTGVPKSVVHTNYSVMTECLAWCFELGLARSASFYVSRPLFYTGGLVLALATLMSRGLLIVHNFSNDNSPSEFLAKLEEATQGARIDRCFAVPEQMRSVLQLGPAWPSLGNPALILTMGSKIRSTEKREIARIFGCKMVESWGNSEGLGTITDPGDLEIRPDSIGRPFATERLWIMNDDLQECAPREVGRLVGSDETMFKEYAGRPEATDKAKRRGLLISDDIGYTDEEGYFYILGREQDVVVVGEHSISLLDVEHQVREIPGISDAYVGCALFEGDKERLVSAVVLTHSDDPAPMAEVTKILVSQSPVRFATPTVTVLEAIPKLASGKTDRLRAKTIAQRGAGER